MTQPYGNYQLEVYFQGLNGVLPNLPMSFAELESRDAGKPIAAVLRQAALDDGRQARQRVGAAVRGGIRR